MIKVGIIDNDEYARKDIKRILGKNCLDGKEIPLKILFDTGDWILIQDLDVATPDVLLLDIDHQDEMAHGI